jgi:hypothetical protein
LQAVAERQRVVEVAAAQGDAADLQRHGFRVRLHEVEDPVEARISRTDRHAVDEVRDRVGGSGLPADPHPALIPVRPSAAGGPA